MGTNEDFGEIVKLPEHYSVFWQEYYGFISQLGDSLKDDDKKYFTRRIQAILPNADSVIEANRSKIVLSSPYKAVPVIHDVENKLVYDRMDGYGRGSGGLHHVEHQTRIGLLPEIRTVLHPEFIRSFRRITPFLERVWKSKYGNVYPRGNAQLVQVLFKLCDSLWKQEKPSGIDTYLVNGTELQSIPTSHPVETSVAEIYARIGRHNFDKFAKEYFRLQKLIKDSGEIDPEISSKLERRIKELLTSLEEKAILQS